MVKRIYIQRLKLILSFFKRKVKTYRFIAQYFAKKIAYSLSKSFPALSRWYINHFPSVRLHSKMDPWEYSINFSSEMLVAALVLVVVIVNLVVFNPLKADYTHTDNSLAADLLSNHTGLNSQLAYKQNTISTTIAGKNGFINQALADNAGSVLSATDTVDFEPTEDGIDDNGITKANPDSVQKLVSRQVQIYQTQPFDTVYTVAAKFGLSTQTIRDTNSLPNNALKAGWYLVIPPVDGVVILVNDPNLTVGDVAHKYSASVSEIVSYNGLQDEEDMVPVGDYLIVPHGTLPVPAAPKPATPSAPAAKPSIPVAVKITGSHRFAPGQCTDYVAHRMVIPWGGNANQWIANSRAYGAYTDKKPAVGAILVTNENSRYGHVAYIESVSGNTFTISEWNYAGKYKKTIRTFTVGDPRIRGIIHYNP